MHFARIELHLKGVFRTINTTIRGSGPRELATGVFYCLSQNYFSVHPRFNYLFLPCLIIKGIDSKLLLMPVNLTKL